MPKRLNKTLQNIIQRSINIATNDKACKRNKTRSDHHNKAYYKYPKARDRFVLLVNVMSTQRIATRGRSHSNGGGGALVGLRKGKSKSWLPQLGYLFVNGPNATYARCHKSSKWKRLSDCQTRDKCDWLIKIIPSYRNMNYVFEFQYQPTWGHQI